jgi:hypothetical protein
MNTVANNISTRIQSIAISLLIVFTFLLDVNLIYSWFVLVAFVFILLKCKIGLFANPTSFIFALSLIVSLAIGIYTYGIGITLLLSSLFLLRLRLRYDFSPSVLLGFLIIQIFFAIGQFISPEETSQIVSSISDGRIQIVDYSRQEIHNLRMTGLFSNPNTAAIALITSYFLYVYASESPFSKLLYSAIGAGLVLFGSRAGLLSFVILSFVLVLHMRSARYFIGVCSIAALCAILLISDTLNFRIFNIIDLLFGMDLSSSARIESVINYVSELYSSGAFLTALFGNGYIDTSFRMFDGDVGNLIFMFGFFGTFCFLAVVLNRFSKSKYRSVMFVLLPFFFGGGIFGNQKTLFILFVLTNIPLLSMKRELIKPSDL